MSNHFEREAKLMVFGPLILAGFGLLLGMVFGNRMSENQGDKGVMCHSDLEMTSNESVPVAREIAESLGYESTLSEVLVALGPARRDVGSGVLVLEWGLIGGGTLQVSSGMDTCRKINGYRIQLPGPWR